jgi:hypothetical protein
MFQEGYVCVYCSLQISRMVGISIVEYVILHIKLNEAIRNFTCKL